MTKTNLEQALSMARGNLPVFPCRPHKQIVSGKLRKAKSPHTSHGFHDATTDLKQIEKWWKRWPDALIGVPTGKATNLLVADVDPQGAPWHIENAERLECGRVHRTPRTGNHLLYHMPPNMSIAISAGEVAPGVDIRADGGYVIWWPAHGLPRVGEMDDIGPPPEWLVSAIITAKKTNGHEKPNGSTVVPNTNPVASISTAEGARHGKMVKLAAVWRAKDLAPDEIEALLWDYSARFFDPPHSKEDRADRGELQEIAHWFENKASTQSEHALTVLSTEELCQLAKTVPCRKILDPVLPEAGGLMIYGSTGAGKSHLGLCIGLALATAQPFLDWTAESPVDVLYVDGEMPLDELALRIRQYAGTERPPRLHWIAARAREEDLPNLADPAGQALYLAAALSCGAKVVAFDNLSCLRTTSAELPENSSEAWKPVADFIRRLNRLGIAVILVHHAGKSGEQRGSSSHPQPFDTVIKMAPAKQPDWRAKNDVEMGFDKHRRFSGVAAAPFRAQAIEKSEGRVAWERTGLDPLADDVVRLRKEGKSIRDMAKALGCAKNAIQKAIVRAKAQGLLPLSSTNE